jgi:HEAT repeat protein/energy-coupling factor transporter ATP-binding protein EcfA2
MYVKNGGIMRKVKVFISSIISGYLDRRDAAEDAITELNHDECFNFNAIRIEANKHPAKNKSPQKACLDGVKESDIYLGIYPRNNYGSKISPLDISPTHEEFRQAVKENKCRLAFIENTKEIDPRQEIFLKEVGDYVEGRFLNIFEHRNVDQLKHLVYRALLNLMKANFKDCLPIYLKALLQRHKQIIRPWEEKIASLPINEIVQLKLVEQEEKKKSQIEYNENERSSKKPSKSLLFSNAIKENQRLLIVGDPGAGKSTSLQWVTFSYAKQISSSQKELPVPIYLELRWYQDNLIELILSYFGKNGIVCDEENVKDWIKKERFLFILDGFDEVRDLSKCLRDINQLLGLSRESKFIIASRKLDYLKDFQNLGFKKVEVKQLSDPQMKLFIEKYLGKEKVSKLLKELKKHNLLNEARNPLILWFMTLEFGEDKPKISINKGMLFKNVIECYFLKEWERKVIPAKQDIQKYIDLKIIVLSKLAFSMIENEDLINIKEEKARKIIDAFLRDGRKNYKDLADEILKQLFASHILIKSNSLVSFWHKSFRDYFAALKLKEIFLREPGEFIRRYITEKWEKPILFLVGVMDDPSDFVARLTQPFWQYFSKRFPFRLSLAAKCIGASNNVSIEIQQKIIENLTKIIQIWSSKDKLREPIRNLKTIFFPIFFDIEEAFQAFGEMRSEKAAEILGDFLENHECNAPLWISGNHPCYFCQCAVKALQNVPLTEKAQNSLLFAALQHKDGVVRHYAKDILREGMTQKTASKLIKIMLDINEKNVIHEGVFQDQYGLLIKDYPIRQRAIDIICGYMGEVLKYPGKVIDPLIYIALEEKCDDLREKAAQALGVGHHKDKDKEEKVIQNLIHVLLENPDANIRANAAHALIYHTSNKVTEAFIQALDDEDREVLKRAAYGLACINPNTLEEENEASQKLLKLFIHEDNDVRINVLWTYGIIRKNPNNEEITQLINLLKDKNISIRCRAAETLGRLKAASALYALKHIVEDEKYIYPWAYAIWAILQIEPSFSEIIKEKSWEYPYINQLYCDDIDERRMAVEVLRRIGTEISFSFLKEINDDHEKSKEIDDELFYAINDIKARIKGNNL